MVQSNSWFPIAAASIPNAFSAAIAGRPKLKLETGVPCISSPASSRIVVQKHTRARLSSHGFSAAAPPTGRPADQGQTCDSSAPWKSLIASTRSSVLSGRVTAATVGVNAWRRAVRASAGSTDQLGVNTPCTIRWRRARLIGAEVGGGLLQVGVELIPGDADGAQRVLVGVDPRHVALSYFPFR